MTLKAQRRVFAVFVLLSLGLAGLFGLIVAQPTWIGGLAGDPTGGHISEHFRQPEHRIHDLAFGLLLGTTVIGLLVQVRTPARNVSGQLMGATPILALMLAVVATGPRVLAIPWVAVGAPTIVATMLHPDLFRSIKAVRPSRRMIFVVAIGAVPSLALASGSIGLQRSGLGDHAALGHYGYMAAFALTVIGVSVMSSLRFAGWRLTAWVGGSLAIVLGVVSLVWLDVEGSLGVLGGLLAIAWGAGYTAVAELVHREDRGAS
jgi:hypothetical protein